MRDRGEDLTGDLLQRLEQEVHPAVGRVVGEPAAAPRSRPARRPSRSRPASSPGSRARWATSAKITRSTASPSSRRPAATRRIAAPIPSRSQTRSSVHAPPSRRESRTSTSPPGRRGRGLLRGQEPRDRGHQPLQRVLVDLLGAAEVVDHLRRRRAGLRMPLVVRQLQVGHHRAVPVGAPGLPQVHTYTPPRHPRTVERHATSRVPTRISRSGTPPSR